MSIHIFVVVMFICLTSQTLATSTNASLTACQSAQRSSSGRIGGFRPQCDEEGNYSPTQTHGSTGYSWCVDRLTGEEVVGSRIPPGSGTIPHCRDCKHKRNATLSKNLIGSYAPQCTDDGFYSRIQSHGSTGNSWCVNQLTGEEKEASRVGPGGQADCTEHTPQITQIAASFASDQKELVVSFVEVMAAPNVKFVIYYTNEPSTPLSTWNAVVVPIPDDTRSFTIRNFLPQSDATYHIKIRPASETGVFGSVTGHVEVASASQTACQRAQGRSSGRIGGFRPQCDEEGNYKPTQTHGSTGYSWCVDRITGEEVMGSRIPPGSGTIPHCRDCKHKRNATLSKGLIGSHAPQCTDDGFYSRIQSHGSSGHSWCVNQLTGEEKEGSRVGPGGQVDCTEHTPQITEIAATLTPSKDELWVSYIEVMAASNQKFVIYYTNEKSRPLSKWNAVVVPVPDDTRRFTIRNFLAESDDTYYIKTRPVSENGAFGDVVGYDVQVNALDASDIPSKVAIKNVTRVDNSGALIVNWQWPSNWERSWEFIVHTAEGLHQGTDIPDGADESVVSGNLDSLYVLFKSRSTAYTVWVQGRNAAGTSPMSDPFQAPAVEEENE